MARPMSTGSPNEYWLAQPCLMARPMSTGSPIGPLVLARPTCFDTEAPHSCPAKKPAPPAWHRSLQPGRTTCPDRSHSPTGSPNDSTRACPKKWVMPFQFRGTCVLEHHSRLTCHPAAPPAWHSLHPGRTTSLYTKVGIPTSVFCPKNPSPGQRRRSVSETVLARPAVNPGVGTGLLHSILVWAQDCPLNPGVGTGLPRVSLKTHSAVQHYAPRLAARIARKTPSARLYTETRRPDCPEKTVSAGWYTATR